MKTLAWATCALVAASVACSSKEDATGPADAESPDAVATVAARPYELNVPPSYDASKPTPLVVMFHGYSSTGPDEEAYMGLTATSNSAGFLYAYGNGTVDDAGERFWNATDGCCNFYGSTVDDVGYFNAIVDDVSFHYNVDPKRIFVVGHSNGGFMAHRLACDVSTRVASIVALAGVVWDDPSKCNPTEHVPVLDVHGTVDTEILYDGGSTAPGHIYPSEATTMETWASKNGCTGQLTATSQTLSIDVSVAGNATTTAAVQGCPSGVDVELYTMQGSGHIPALGSSWGPTVWGFFSAHPKP
jgi:polyhydroxybutyrate depolymerase